MNIFYLPKRRDLVVESNLIFNRIRRKSKTSIDNVTRQAKPTRLDQTTKHNHIHVESRLQRLTARTRLCKPNNSLIPSSML